MIATTCPHCGAKRKKHHNQYHCMTAFDASGAVVYQGKACMRIELNAAKRRIERLIEAGDLLSGYLSNMPYAVDYSAQEGERKLRAINWTKAKEDKL